MHWRWTVTYRCHYFPINSHRSECDHYCKTQSTELEIGTCWSGQIRRNLQVDGYGSGFGPPRVSVLGFWTGLELNRPVIEVQTQNAGGLPGPVANTRHEPSWQFCLHCGIEETGSPGILCIICHQVLCHLSEHGTSLMGILLETKAPIAVLNELTVRSYWVDKFDGPRNSFNHPEEVRTSRNDTSQFADKMHIQHPGWSILTEITDITLQTGS